MTFGIFTRLLSPLTCSTQPDSLSSINYSHQIFHGINLIGSVCFVGVIITRPLISWYVNGSQNIEVLIKRCGLAKRFPRDEVGHGITDEVGNGIRDEVCWENLLLELWGEIGKRMVSRLDIITFRSVCKKWRSSLPSPTGRFPLVLPPPPSCGPEFRDIPYAISELNIYSGGGILGKPYMQVDQTGLLSLSSKLSILGDKADFEDRIVNGPVCRLRTRRSICDDQADRDHGSIIGDKVITWSHLSFFAKVYYPCKAIDSHEIRHDRMCNHFPKKVVLISSSNADGVNPNYARMCDLSVVALLGGEMKGRLTLLRLGGSPEDWVWETDFCTQVFVNIATYKGKLCTLDHYGRVFLMDYDSLKLTQVCAPSSFPFELEGKSLFEFRGDLYLVDFKFDAEVYDLDTVLLKAMIDEEAYQEYKCRMMKSGRWPGLPNYWINPELLNTRFEVEAYKLSLQLQMWVKGERIARPYIGVVAPFVL